MPADARVTSGFEDGPTLCCNSWSNLEGRASSSCTKLAEGAYTFIQASTIQSFINSRGNIMLDQTLAIQVDRSDLTVLAARSLQSLNLNLQIQGMHGEASLDMLRT